MLENLKNVLYAEKITVKAFADYLGITEKTAQNKIQGKTQFTYPEVKKTCALLPKYNVDYLFASQASA